MRIPKEKLIIFSETLHIIQEYIDMNISTTFKIDKKIEIPKIIAYLIIKAVPNHMHSTIKYIYYY